MPCHAIGSYSQARSIRSYSPPSTRRTHRTAPPYLYIYPPMPARPPRLPGLGWPAGARVYTLAGSGLGHKKRPARTRRLAGPGRADSHCSRTAT